MKIFEIKKIIYIYMITKFQLFEKYGYLDEIECEYVEKACEDLGYKVVKYLGSGEYGSAFKIADKHGDEKVMKITSDRAEASMANKLRKRPVSKHLINYYDVRTILDNVNIEEPYFSIIMDQVTPLTEYEQGIYDNIDTFNTKRTMLDKNLSSEDKKRILDGIEERLPKKEVYSNMYKQFVEIIKELIKNKMRGADLHAGNVGWDKDGNLVHYDIGLEEVTSGKRLKPIKSRTYQ